MRSKQESCASNTEAVAKLSRAARAERIRKLNDDALAAACATPCQRNRGAFATSVFGHRARLQRSMSSGPRGTGCSKRIDAPPTRSPFCATLPWSGPVTKFRLAKNPGGDFAKPDVHLNRLAEAEASPRKRRASGSPTRAAIAPPPSMPSSGKLGRAGSSIRDEKLTRCGAARRSNSANVGHQRSRSTAWAPECGGAEGNRTPDLCSAIAALSHLSYSPAPRWAAL